MELFFLFQYMDTKDLASSCSTKYLFISAFHCPCFLLTCLIIHVILISSIQALLELHLTLYRECKLFDTLVCLCFYFSLVWIDFFILVFGLN